MTKIKLVLLIFGEEIDLTSLTNVMKLTPANYWEKGDKILGRKRELIRKESCWELDFKFVNTLYLDEVTDQVVMKLSNNLNSISNYIKENNFCFVLIRISINLNKNITLSFVMFDMYINEYVFQ